MTSSGLVPDEARTTKLRRLGPRSLTARLSVGVVTLVVMLVGAIGVTTYFALKPFLYDRLDQQVGPVASGNAGLLSGCENHGVSNCYIGSGPGNYSAPENEWVVLLNRSGTAVGGPQSNRAPLRYLSMTAADRSYVASHVDQFVTVQTTDGYQVRVVARRFDRDSTDVIVSGLSTDELRRTLGHLIAIELIIGSGAVIVALLATYYGVGFGLRRLRRVTATANEVAAEVSPTGTGLDRRVDVEDDGTEVGQLAESMNTLLSAVEMQFAARLESETRLRQFLADASHELRTPLTSIRGYAELARMQKAAGESGEDNLSRIESEGTRMSRLVEDLLMLARGDQAAQGQPVQELVDVGELAEDAVQGTRAAFPERVIHTEGPTGLHVVGDRDQLLRAVRNLVTNAAVHTDPDRPIVVRCVEVGTDVAIQVIDGGPGLPPEQAAHVFERFWRADKARSRARGGTGLGMSIVASIVAANGGSVRFDSTVEAGSTVTITLPAVSD